jgi:hypothetical protein
MIAVNQNNGCTSISSAHVIKKMDVPMCAHACVRACTHPCFPAGGAAASVGVEVALEGVQLTGDVLYEAVESRHLRLELGHIGYREWQREIDERK